MEWKGKTKSDYSGAERGAGRQQQPGGASSTVCGSGRWDYDEEYQKLLDEAGAQLAKARTEYAKAATEYARCRRTYSEAVRARPRPPADEDSEKQQENNHGEGGFPDDDGGGGDGMELDGQWEPLRATLAVVQKLLADEARGSSTKKRLPGPYSSSDHAKQEQDESGELAGRMESGQRGADEKSEGKAGGAEGAAAGGQ